VIIDQSRETSRSIVACTLIIGNNTPALQLLLLLMMMMMMQIHRC